MSRLALLLVFSVVVSECPETCGLSAVRAMQKENGICDAQCNTPQCGFGEGGECLEKCWESGCQVHSLADHRCDAECSALVCGLDRGDCGYCSPGCYLYMLEDEMCQEACFVSECDYDRGNCDGCAPLCFTEEFFVYEGTQVGNGSAAAPYSLLSTAIEFATGYLTAIYLLGSRVTLSFPKSIHSPIRITSLTCGERQSPFCSDHLTTIDIVKAASFTISSDVTFQRVIFTTISIFKGLEEKGCPTLVMKEGIWVDRDYNPASQDSITAWNLCSDFADLSVFSVESGSIILIVTFIQSVNVTDILMQPKAFIQVKAGNVSLESVHFVGVETLRGAGEGAVILTTESCGECKVSYRGGSVHRLNAGAQYLEEAKSSPFLHAKSLLTLEVVHVSFTSNAVIDAYSNVLAPSTRALLFLGNFLQVRMSDCEFRSNFVSGGLIVIDSSVLLSRDPNSDNIAYQLSATHIDFRNISFQWNLGEHCLIGISFTGDVLNVQLVDMEFIDNAIEGENFLSFGSQAAATESLAYGTEDEVLLNNGTKGRVWVPPRTFVLQGVTIRNSYAFHNLIFIHNLANVNISHLLISDSGDFDPDILPHTFASCCSAAPVTPAFPAAPVCSTLLSTDGCFRITLAHTQILRNGCSQSGTALFTSTSQGLLRLSNFTAAGNFGSSYYGLVLAIYNEPDVEGDFLVFRNNTNGSGSAVFFHTFTSATISHSLFEDNIGVYGGIFYFYLVQKAEIRNCTFRRTTAVDSMGGVALFQSGNYLPVVFTIEDCVFELNTATNGGGVAFDSLNATTLVFSVKRSLFISNTAEVFGSGVYVTAPIVFAEESTIEDSTFESSTAPYGAVALKHAHTLHVSRCLFRHNYGSAAAAVFIETPPDAITILEDVAFLGNYGSSTVLKSNSRTNSTFMSRNCTYADNPDGNVAMEGGFWRDFSSTYSHSKFSQLLLSFGAEAQLIGAEFSDNFESDSGAAVHVMTGSIFSCVDCRFANNSAGQNGGAIYAEQEATVHIDNCLFTYNSAGSGGGALSFASSLKSLSAIRSTVLQDNYGGNLGVIFAQSATFLLDNVTIAANTGEGCPGITLLMAHATISNSVLQSMSGSLAAFLSMYTSSSANVSSSEFAHGLVISGGAIYLSSHCNLAVSKSLFRNISCERGGAISALSSSRVSLTEVVMKRIVSQVSGSLLSLSDSSLAVSWSEFSGFHNYGIFGYQLSEVVISTSIFAEGKGEFGGAADFEECDVVRIIDSTFTALKAPLGGALHFESTVAKTAEISVDSCRFMENEGRLGGAIYAITHNLTVLNSFFTQNNAAEGGSIYFDCSAKCAYSITETTFMNNSAATRGGAVAWLTTQPTLRSVSFQDNTARYGPDIASFPLLVRIDNITKYASAIAPGQPLDTAILASLRDHYSQVVLTHSSSVAHLTAQSANSTVSGETKVTAFEGHFVFSQFQVYARPNSSVTLAVASASAQGGAQVALRVRECRPGEFQTSDSCLVCSPGTFRLSKKRLLHKYCANRTHCHQFIDI